MSDDLEQRVAAAAPRPTQPLDYDQVAARTRSLRLRRRAGAAGLLGLAGLCTVAVVQLVGGTTPVEVGPDPMRPSPTAMVPAPTPTVARPTLDCPDAADQVASRRMTTEEEGSADAPELVSVRTAVAAEAVAWQNRTIASESGLPPVTLHPPEYLVEAPPDATTWVCVYWSEAGFSSIASQGPPYRYLVVVAVEDGHAQMLAAHPDPPTGEALGPNADPDATLPAWHTPAPPATCYLSGDIIAIDAGPDGNEWQLAVTPDQPVTIEATVDVPASLYVDRLQWEITPEGPSRVYQGGPLGEPGPPVAWWTIAATDLGPGQHTLDITWDATDGDGNPVPPGEYHVTGVAQARPTDLSGVPCEDAQTTTMGAGLGYVAVP